MLYFFLVYIIFMVFLLMLITNGDAFSPAAICCWAFLAAAICVIYNKDVWAVRLTIQTIVVIIAGVSSFSIGTLLVYQRNRARRSAFRQLYQKKEINIGQEIVMPQKQLLLLLLLSLIMFVIIVRSTLRSVSLVNIAASTFADVSNAYRMNTSYGEGVSISRYVSEILKLFRAVSFISMSILVNNIVANKKLTRANIIHIIPMFLYIVATFLQGQRTDAFRLFLGGISLFLVMVRRKSGLLKRVKMRTVFRIVLLAVSTVFLMVAARNLVGRNDDTDLLYSLAHYGGGGIVGLDQYLQDGTLVKSGVGRETFIGLINNLASLGLTESTTVHREFRRINGVSIGNIYTAFRAYYHDFGWAGVILLCAIFGMCIQALYERSCALRNNHGFSMILYSVFVPAVYLMIIGDQFYAVWISLGQVSTYIYLFFLYRIFIGKGRSRIKIRIRR